MSSPSTTQVFRESAESASSDRKVRWRMAAIGWGSLVVAGIEAACVTFIALNAFAVALGAGTIALAGWATYLHNIDAIRLPLLALASLGALANVLVIANGWWLRRAPSARWRYRPLTGAQWRRIVLVLGSSVITLAIVIAELHEHKVLHGHY